MNAPEEEGAQQGLQKKRRFLLEPPRGNEFRMGELDGILFGGIVF